MQTEQKQTDNKCFGRDIKRPRKIQKPKRNKNAFILFSNDKRAELRGKLSLNSNQMMAELADRWKMASQEEKNNYTARAEQDKQRYVDECEAFISKHPEISIGNRTKNNYSKKAVSGYGIFMSEMKDIIRSQNPGRILMADVIPQVAKLWRELPDEEVERYKQLSLDKKEKSVSKKGSKSKLSKRAMNDEDIPKARKLVKGSDSTLSSSTTTTTASTEHSQDGTAEDLKIDTLSLDFSSNYSLSHSKDDLVTKLSDCFFNGFSMENFVADDQKFDYLLSPMKLSHELLATDEIECDNILDYKMPRNVEEGVDLYSFCNESTTNYFFHGLGESD